MGKILIGNLADITYVKAQSFVDCHIIIVVGSVLFASCQFENCTIDEMEGAKAAFAGCSFDKQPEGFDLRSMTTCFIKDGPLNL